MTRKLILLIFILFQTYSLNVWSEITFKPLFDKSDKQTKILYFGGHLLFNYFKDNRKEPQNSE